ncbi:DUF3383 domain-containing protein [Novosphingobium sp.]|uniref:DUF3383 domain-containing protein n=1 Tax=Novosphingobium sp. TaxID=1874826 RepID=UPI00262A4A66|nr:DUF3383 domain-containing protein [Novosphingobium sp.]
MTTGLPVSRLITASVNLTPAGAQYANIETLLLLGDSPVIDTLTRIRSYNSLAGVAADFGTSAPEYAAALLYFGQSPQPTQLYIGRWARTATAGALYGAPLTAAQQALANFTAVTAGGFKVQVNGGALTGVTGINLSTATSLSQVASLITTALTGASLAATCVWTGSQFQIVSTTTGTSSSVSLLQAPASGTDISGLLGGTAGAGAYAVAGIAAESALAAVTALDAIPTYWYGLTFAASTMPSNSDYLAVAAFIEATTHIFGLTTADANAVNSASNTDIGSQLIAAGYTRTFGQYSTTNPYAVISIFGSILTTQFNGSNTMPTVAWKVEPGVPYEPLSQNAASVLDTKRYNYFANFQNGASVLVNGCCFGQAYVDEIFGLDWLQNRIQTNLFNLLAAQPKVPQTDPGIHQFVNVIDQSMEAAITNGLVAPGQWQAAGFGQLQTGDYLNAGYYIYAPPISTQSSADRAARKSPPIQVAVKLAGAVHTVNAIINVNR